MFTLDNRLHYFSWMYFQLRSLILLVASIPIEKGPSEERKKVAGLMKAAYSRLKADELKTSSVKQGHSANGAYGY